MRTTVCMIVCRLSLNVLTPERRCAYTSLAVWASRAHVLWVDHAACSFNTSPVVWWAATRRFTRCGPLSVGKDWRVCESERNTSIERGYERT